MEQNRPSFVFVSQAINDSSVALAKRAAEELGPTLLHSGTPVVPVTPNLRIRRSTAYDNSSLRRRLVTWACYLVDAALQVGRLDGRRILVLTTNPPLLPLLGWAMKRLRGWPYMVRVWDVYPDALFRAGVLGAQHPIVRLWSWANSVWLANVDLVVTLGPMMAASIRVHAQCPVRIEIQPEWVDEAQPRPTCRSSNAVAVELGVTDRFVVMYAGNYGATHDLTGLLEVATELDPEGLVEFLFVGGGARRAELEAACAKLNHARVLPYQPAVRFQDLLSCADVSVIAVGSPALGVSMPSKSASALAAGSPLLVLSPGASDLSLLVEEHQIGTVVDPRDRAGIRHAIEYLRDDPEERRKRSEAARHVAETTLSCARAESRYLEWLRWMAD